MTNVDEFDIKILKEMWNLKKECSTYHIAKKIFNQKKNDYLMKKYDEFVRKRLKKWVNEGIIKVNENNGRSSYHLVESNAIFGKGKLDINVNGRIEKIDMGEVFIYKNKEWSLFQI